MKILIVENTISHGIFLKAILKKIGYEYEYTENGQEAINLLNKNEKFDVILMDIEMPVIDGIHATKIIRQFKSKVSKIPIILMTAHNNADAVELLKYGFNDYITKPYKIRNIISTINKNINKQYE